MDAVLQELPRFGVAGLIILALGLMCRRLYYDLIAEKNARIADAERNLALLMGVQDKTNTLVEKLHDALELIKTQRGPGE